MSWSEQAVFLPGVLFFPPNMALGLIFGNSDDKSCFFFEVPGLVNIQKTMENQHVSWVNLLFRLGHFQQQTVSLPEGTQKCSDKPIARDPSSCPAMR